MRFTRVLRFEVFPRQPLNKEYKQLGMDFPSSRMTHYKAPDPHKEKICVTTNLMSATVGAVIGFFLSKSLIDENK
jgi:hypothetical protein